MTSRRTSGGRSRGLVARMTPKLDRESQLWHGLDREEPAFPHIARVLAQLVALYGFDPHDPGVVEKAIKRGRLDYESDLRNAAEWASILCDNAIVSGSVVYYMRIGNRCKIGYSTSLRTRLEVIHPEELLATEPGGLAQERVRHQQFSRLHVYGEWFSYEDELVEHVEHLKGLAEAG